MTAASALLGAGLAGLALGAALSASRPGPAPEAEADWRAPPAAPANTDAQALINLFAQTGHLVGPPPPDERGSEGAGDDDVAPDTDVLPRILALANRDGALVVFLSERDAPGDRYQSLELGQASAGGYELVAATRRQVIFERDGERIAVPLHSGVGRLALGTAR